MPSKSDVHFPKKIQWSAGSTSEHLPEVAHIITSAPFL